MIDLHCHLLPGIDDGAHDVDVALEMARMFVADGVTTVACTPHILPGVYHNTGPQILAATADLQATLDAEGIDLRLVSGCDAHVVPDFVTGLRSGHLLSLANSRYVLVEPPHHVAPPRLDALFFQILVAGYVPILTHPERLSWLKAQYDMVVRLAQAGVWMQITCGSLAGGFGRDAQYWAERMLEEGLVHILATDAHDTKRRPPLMSQGRKDAARRVGAEEATNLVSVRPKGVLDNLPPSSLPPPKSGLELSGIAHAGRGTSETDRGDSSRAPPLGDGRKSRGLWRSLFGE